MAFVAWREALACDMLGLVNSVTCHADSLYD